MTRPTHPASKQRIYSELKAAHIPGDDASYHSLGMAYWALGQPLLFDPGTGAAYSNVAFVILDGIIEQVTHRRYADVAQQLVLAPAGATSARFSSGDQFFPGEATRYGKDHAPLGEAGQDFYSWNMTTVDMVKVLMALDAERILDARTLALMLAPPPPTVPRRPNGSWFGFGLDAVTRTPASLSYHKDGGMAGVAAWLEHLPNGLCFAVLCNQLPGLPFAAIGRALTAENALSGKRTLFQPSSF